MKNKKLLIIGFVWPEPKGSAAGSRMMQLIEFFKEIGYTITFCTSNSKSNQAEDLDLFGVDSKQIELNSSSFDEFLLELNPHLVLFDRFMTEEQFGWRVAQCCPEAIKVLDSEDLHFLRKGRGEALKNKKSFDDSYLFNSVAKREIASIYRCDLTLIISEFELALLIQKFNLDKSILFYLPFLLDPLTKNISDALPLFEHREHFISIGNFLHEPNFDAVLQLKRTIWPKIREKLPESKLYIYGAYPQQKALQLHNENEGLLVKGFVENPDAMMSQTRVCLASLRFGAGLKGKLITAMTNGTPAVMSSIAAEAMFGDCTPNGFVEDYEDAFVSSAIKLYTNRNLWLESQSNGFEIINTRFQKKDFHPLLSEAIRKLEIDLKKHRQKNFIGQMLMHHSMQSTKFMSKWIEEKNTKNQIL